MIFSKINKNICEETKDPETSEYAPSSWEKLFCGFFEFSLIMKN